MSGLFCLLFFRLRLKRLNGNKRLASSFLFKLYDTVYLSMQRMVFACIHVIARIVFGSALSNNDVSC